MSRGISVCMVTRLRARRSGFDSRQGLVRTFFLAASKQILRSIYPPHQWIPRIKRPGPKGDHSPPSGANVTNGWSYRSTPPYVFIAWCLVEHRVRL